MTPLEEYRAERIAWEALAERAGIVRDKVKQLERDTEQLLWDTTLVVERIGDEQV
jgi:hypothetical protein